MEYAPDVVFHNLEPSEFVEIAAPEKIDKLVELDPVIVRCRVVIDAPHKRKHQGHFYEVRVIAKSPQDGIVVS